MPRLRPSLLVSLLIVLASSAVTAPRPVLGSPGNPPDAHTERLCDADSDRTCGAVSGAYSEAPGDAVALVTAFFELVDDLAVVVAIEDDERVSTGFGQPLNTRQLMLLGQTFRAADLRVVDQDLDGPRATLRALLIYPGPSPQWRTFELRHTQPERRVFSVSPPPAHDAKDADSVPEVVESEPIRQLKNFMLLMNTADNMMMPSREGMNFMLLWGFLHGRQSGDWGSVQIGNASEWKDFSSTGFQIPVTLRGAQKTSHWHFVVEPNEVNAGKLAINNLDTVQLR